MGHIECIHMTYYIKYDISTLKYEIKAQVSFPKIYFENPKSLTNQKHLIKIL